MFIHCTSDADCTERPLGYCAPGYAGGPVNYDIRCHYGCLSDADCGAGQLCECGDPVGRCVAAECQSDQDCPGELQCAAWFTQEVCTGSHAYSCQSAEDECNTAADCGSGICSGEGGRRRCVPHQLVACGRPFLVQDEARVAGLLREPDWSGKQAALQGAALDDAALSATVRRRIGEHWAQAALMEHASIAAFARFTLQLLHVGAPRELIEDSQRAMWDETSHAQACFALASRYLSMPLGPGPLPMTGALQEMTLEQIVLTAFREGCVGETVAALEASEAGEAAADSAVQRTLAQIAADELRHAELAWRFVRWALEVGTPAVASLVAAELALLEAEAAGQPARAELPAQPTAAAAHGVLPPGRSALLRRLALSEVVLPCARQLLERVPAERHKPAAVSRRHSLTLERRCAP